MISRTPAQVIGSILARIRLIMSTPWKWEARMKGVVFQGKVRLAGRPMISVAPDSRLVLGDGVCLFSATRANSLACFQPSVLRTLAPGAELVLGPNVGMSGTVMCAGLRIVVGEGSIFGSGVMVIDNDFHSPQGEWGWNTSLFSEASSHAALCSSVETPRFIVLKLPAVFGQLPYSGWTPSCCAVN